MWPEYQSDAVDFWTFLQQKGKSPIFFFLFLELDFILSYSVFVFYCSYILCFFFFLISMAAFTIISRVEFLRRGLFMN